MDDWIQVSVLELAGGRRELFNDGDWIESPYITTSGNRLLQTGNIGVGQLLDRGTKRYISDDSFAALKCKEVVIGDILICRLAEPAGRACIATDIGERRMLTSVDVTIFRPDPKKVDRRFLVAAFSTTEWFREVIERCGGSTRTRVARSELGRIKLRIPGLAEQQQIADTLSDINAQIATLERSISKKQAIKCGMMQQLLSGETRLSGFSQKWRTTTIGDACITFSGGTPSTTHPEYYGGSIPWITSGDLNLGRIASVDGRITPRGLEKSAAKLVPAETPLIALYGATAGVAAITEFEGAINQAILAMVPRKIDGEFLFQWLRANRGTIIDRYTQGGQPNLSGAIVRSIEVPRPDPIEQRQIARALRELDRLVAVLFARLTKARAIKLGMTQQLLTGRTRLPVADPST